MRMRFLGKSGIKVSELCLGTMTFGPNARMKPLGAVDQKGADTIVSMALDGGINFFDTADIYSEGQSEVTLGKALGSRRKEVVLATKFRNRIGTGPNDVGFSRHHIIEACEASLKRLGTDYIDLYIVHRFDSSRPLEECMHTLDDLVRQGKVRYIGASNFTGWQLMKAMAISDKYGWEKFISFQGLYSLLARDIEYELAPLCVDQGLGITTWSPLAGGFLSGKFRRGMPKPQGARMSDRPPTFDEQKAYDVIEELDKIAAAHHGSGSQAALNWLLCKPGVSSMVCGIRTPEQLADNLKTAAWEMLPEEAERLDKLSKPAPVYPYDFQAHYPAE